MKIYIAGPMTGYKNFNFKSFDRARDNFEKQGYVVFSPADHDRTLLGKSENWIPKEKDSVGPWKKWAIQGAPSLREMLGADLSWIAEHGTAIYMLKGWEKSNGARAEHALAVALDLEILYE